MRRRENRVICFNIAFLIDYKIRVQNNLNLKLSSRNSVIVMDRWLSRHTTCWSVFKFPEPTMSGGNGRLPVIPVFGR